MPLAPTEALNRVIESRFGVAKLTGFPTLANLAAKNRIRTSRNTNINWNVDRGGETAAFEAVTANSANTLDGNTIAASLTVGTHRLKHQFEISKIEIQNARSLGNEDLQNIFSEYVDRGVNAIMRQLNSAIWNGDGTGTWGGVVGFPVIGNATATYAGIAPATAPLWVPLLDTNGTARALTAGLLRNIRRLMTINETMFDMVMCHPDIGGTYERVFETLVGAGSFAGVNDPTNRLRTTDLGHGGRAYQGVPIIEDAQATNNAIVFLDSSDVEVRCLELTPDPNQNLMQKGAHLVNRTYGLPIHIQELESPNTATRKFEFAVYPQIKMHNRKSFARIDNLTANYS